ncbi:uncharacterized protein LOC124679237 isoform X1 [Lolium rigidum]|uniref:uncharacterized protein LOC124679237 isoform X1 n=1 Tax=Lolium rigidum TaxID=89674 RepID=UPI001F5C4CB3|nr:uncharacterized protein LOC124679237 isoform X1 [Lolium rigidum]
MFVNFWINYLDLTLKRMRFSLLQYGIFGRSDTTASGDSPREWILEISLFFLLGYMIRLRSVWQHMFMLTKWILLVMPMNCHVRLKLQRINRGHDFYPAFNNLQVLAAAAIFWYAFHLRGKNLWG